MQPGVDLKDNQGASAALQFWRDDGSAVLSGIPS
jgi:hypothetical protein